MSSRVCPVSRDTTGVNAIQNYGSCLLLARRGSKPGYITGPPPLPRSWGPNSLRIPLCACPHPLRLGLHPLQISVEGHKYGTRSRQRNKSLLMLAPAGKHGHITGPCPTSLKTHTGAFPLPIRQRTRCLCCPVTKTRTKTKPVQQSGTGLRLGPSRSRPGYIYGPIPLPVLCGPPPAQTLDDDECPLPVHPGKRCLCCGTEGDKTGYTSNPQKRTHLLLRPSDTRASQRSHPRPSPLPPPVGGCPLPAPLRMRCL